MKKHLIPILLGTAFATALVTGSFVINGNLNAKDGWSSCSALSGEIGDTLTIPDVAFTNGGQTVTATKVTTFPDGSEKIGDKVELTLSGTYKVTYTANIDGVVHSRVEEFFVDYPHIKVGNKNISSVRYLANPSSEGIPADKSGLFVSLAYGDTLTFSKPIPIDDLVSTNALLKLYVVPQQYLTADFGAITLTLSNPDDPNNNIKIVYYSHIETNSNGSVSHSSSVCAKSDATNVFAGVHQSQGLHTNDKYGTWSGCTFDGYVQPSYSSTKYDNCMFYFGYDDATKQVYGTGFNKGTAGDKVLDLDDPEQVRKVWGGFTCDRVLLSINCDSYSSPTADFVITDLLNVPAQELANNVYVDAEAPVVRLLEDKPLPNGAINYDYSIPEAVAYDKVCLNCPVEVDVYQNYDDLANRTKVKVENNKFKMTNSGYYSIVYTAKDYTGNVGTLIKSISVFNSIKKPEFELPAHETSVDVGTYIKFDKTIPLKSYCGDAILKTYFKSATGEKTLAEDGFRIDKLETYTVYYEASDAIGQTTEKSYDISVVNNSTPILEKEITFPRYLISKGYYETPAIAAYIWENNKLVRKDAELVMTCGSSTPVTYRSGEEYNPVVTTNGELTNLQIKYGSAVLQTVDVPTILSTEKVGAQNRLKLENYFDVKSGEFFLRPNSSKMGYQDKERGAYFLSNAGEDLEFNFINPILADNFSIKINKVLGAKDGTKVTVTLYDSEDKNTAIAASFEYDGTNTYFVVGDKKITCLDNPFNVDDISCSYLLTFNGTSFGYNSSDYLDAIKNIDGTPFTGFTGKKVFVNVKVTNCLTNTRMTVESLGGQTFISGTTADIVSPVIYMSTEIGGTVSLNGIYTTNPMYAYDVLSPNIIFVLNVKDENNKYAKDTDGNEMKEVDPTVSHNIVLSSYGAYTFELVCKEDTRFLSRPNPATLSRVVYVYDDIKPVINMEEQFQSTVTVGTEIRFPKFTYSDNTTATDKLVVQRVYIDANGKYHFMTSEETSIKFSYVGRYKIMINVMDDYGNISNVTMYVNVTK